MDTRAATLSRRLEAFSEEVTAFVQQVPDKYWKQQCEGEDWTLGVVARHIGVGHFGSIELAKLMIEGKPLPDMNAGALAQMGNAHAQKHAQCTREEVLSILRYKGSKMTDYVAGLNEDELDRTGYFTMTGEDVSVAQMLEMIVLHSGGEHLASMRKTAAG